MCTGCFLKRRAVGAAAGIKRRAALLAEIIHQVAREFPG
jgi:hypothetical protein